MDAANKEPVTISKKFSKFVKSQKMVSGFTERAIVEPAYRRKSSAMTRNDRNIPDDSLWYPPIGLMKLVSHFS